MLKKIPFALKNFFLLEASGGIIMLAMSVLAIIAANSGASGYYEDFTAATGNWINDGLMVIFFMVVAVELKKEIRVGVLAQKGQVALPLFAAIGGMAVPAIIYCAFNANWPEAISGWAIPSATDIAFALCVLMLAGRHLPPAARIFLLAIAIFDDLGAIIIIALFYSHSLNLEYLALSTLIIAAMYVLNRKGTENIFLYIILGAFLAWLLQNAGIHTTIAGVIAGIMIPLTAQEKLLNIFHPISTYLVLPIFALVNAGVSLTGLNAGMFSNTITLGIALGLFFGKQIGVFVTTFVIVKLKISTRPHEVSWLQLYAISVLAGIGFTMSLFIGNLAFNAPLLQDQVKLGVIIGSLLSALLGVVILRLEKKIA